MKTVKFKAEFESLCPVLFCKYYESEVPKKKGEKPEDYEERTWMERAWYDGNEVIIPARFFQATLEPIGKLLGERTKGKMSKGYSHYLAGVRIVGQIKTGVKKKNVQSHSAFVVVTGKKEGSKVLRKYPQINKWKGVLELCYADIGILTPEIVVQNLDAAGQLVGIGHWRPGSPSRGEYGLFKVTLIKKG